METSELEYIAVNISNLCNIPIRVYKNREYLYFYYSSSFPKDPIILEEKMLFDKNEDIGYVTTNEFFYYAFLKHEEYMFVLGPFRLIQPDNACLSILSLQLNLSKDEYQQFILSMKNITPQPLESALNSLCLINFILSKEQKSVSDILIDDSESEKNKQLISNETKNFSNEKQYLNNTYLIEKELYKMVERGDVSELKRWAKNAPIARTGILANDTLRHVKNTFIAAVTQVSRAAIKGHMDVQEALSLSDLYIQKMELLQNSSDVMALQSNMVFDYTERVAKINNKSDASLLLVNLNKYILSHISDAIKSNNICSSLYISKSVLFDKIKKETGMTLSNYILFVKINEAKELLKYTNQTISTISIYLGFSSQSHFNRAFKKITNKTPIEYRKSHLS